MTLTAFDCVRGSFGIPRILGIIHTLWRSSKTELSPPNQSLLGTCKKKELAFQWCKLLYNKLDPELGLGERGGRSTSLKIRCKMSSGSEGSRLTKHGKVFVLELLGPDDHRLTSSLLSEIMAHLRTVNDSEDAGALVTTSEGKFFCNGLDLEWINGNAEERGPVLFQKFEALLVALLSMKIPTIAAVCGHAAGGGFAFAMAHDHRFMRADRGFLYSGGVDVNVAVPSGTLALVACKTSPRVYRDALLKCIKYTGEMALKAELIDVLCEDSRATIEQATKEAESLAGRNWDQVVYKDMRLAMYPDVVGKLQAGDYLKFAPIGASLKGFK